MAQGHEVENHKQALDAGDTQYQCDGHRTAFTAFAYPPGRHGGAEQEYPEAWILEAISLAVQNNKQNWRYCETILKRWKNKGKDNGKGKPAPTLNDAMRNAGYDV